MPRRRDIRRLVLTVFRSKGPLTDAQLAWWMGEVMKVNANTARKKRRELTIQNEIRFARRVRVTPSGRLQKYWELTPGKRS